MFAQKRVAGILYPALALALLGLYGCSTSSKDVHQFKPLPQVRVGEESLDPVSPRPVIELLRDAEEAFKAANDAQENGDHEAALRHYTLMLELLVEADLDPAIFYSLRDEFGNIIDTSNQQAHLFARHSPGGVGFKPSAGSTEITVPFPLPKRVLTEIEAIQNSYPKNFQRGLDKSQQYLPFILSELEKAGLPQELAWLPMIESLFTPKIVSRAGAGGMWQFMHATGRRYHLRVDKYVDERYNWQSSTKAAIAYLKDLHDFFNGEWPLAISAYNMGENGLERAIASNGGERNLWKLIETPPASNRIRLETKQYYPKFLATLIVASNPERYGFKNNPSEAIDTVRVSIKGMYALDALDEAMGYERGTLAQLNPDLIREVTPATGEYSVAVPVVDRGKFLTALRKTPTLKYGNDTHKVRHGETISQIAERYGVNQRELMALNSIRSARGLQAGKNLRIPGYSSHSGCGGASPEPIESGAKSYTVKRGDTLFDIASAHGVGVKDLQQWNKLGRRSRINVGQSIVVRNPGVPEAPEASEAPEAPVETASDSAPKSSPAKEESYQHKVIAGEFPAKIASKHGVKLDDLLAWNGLNKKSRIRVGDKLTIKKGAAPSTKESSASTPVEIAKAAEKTHTVARGDSASLIASKHGVSTKQLLAWNGLTSRSVLRPGQKLVIHPEAASVSEGAQNSPQGDKVVHMVARGHNPTTIARRYGVKISDLYKWNSWPKNHVLQIGDKVVVYK